MAQDQRTGNANPRIHGPRSPRHRFPPVLALTRRNTVRAETWLPDVRPAETLSRANTQSGVVLAESSLAGPLPQDGLNSERERGYA
jgi:hypothetical protein